MGDGFSCGLATSTNRVDCWGRYDSPVDVELSFLDVEGRMGCGLVADGSYPVCWGSATLDAFLFPSREVNEPPIPLTTLAVGTYHACGLDEQGKAVCWWQQRARSRPDCEVGDYCPEVWEAAPQPQEDARFTTLDSGAFSCGVRSNDATVECWGYDAPTPPAEVQFERVAVGDGFACGIRVVDRQVECWGHSGRPSSLPPEGIEFESLSAGPDAACGIRSDDHRVVCWGDAPEGIVDAAFATVKVGLRHACGITLEEQRAQCWGSQTSDELLPAGETYAMLSADCRLTADGRTECWGRPGPIQERVAFISANVDYVCGIRVADGTAVCGGVERWGRTNPPAEVSFDTLSTGETTVCGIRTTDQRLQCWGAQQLGLADVPAGRFVQVSVGGDRACAIRHDDGSVECWGGSGHTDPPDLRFDAVSLSPTDSCGLVAGTGELQCWDESVDRSWPSTKPMGLVSLDVLVGAANDFCSVNQDGIAQCWGGFNDRDIPFDVSFATVNAYVLGGIQRADGQLYLFDWAQESDNGGAGSYVIRRSKPLGFLSRDPSMGQTCTPVGADATVDYLEMRREHCRYLERCDPELLSLSYWGGDVTACIAYEECDQDRGRRYPLDMRVEPACLEALRSSPCDHPDPSWDPVCAPGGLLALAQGDACGAYECRGYGLYAKQDDCANGLFCDFIDQACRPFLAPDAACQTEGSGHTEGGCPPSRYCDPVEQHCRRWLTAGEPCEVIDTPDRYVDPCLYPRQCVEGSCQLVRGQAGLPNGGEQGSPCDGPRQCLLGLGCGSGGTCVPLACAP